jgi:hypothetical protein
MFQFPSPYHYSINIHFMVYCFLFSSGEADIYIFIGIIIIISSLPSVPSSPLIAINPSRTIINIMSIPSWLQTHNWVQLSSSRGKIITITEQIEATTPAAALFPRNLISLFPHLSFSTGWFFVIRNSLHFPQQNNSAICRSTIHPSLSFIPLPLFSTVLNIPAN